MLEKMLSQMIYNISVSDTSQFRTLKNGLTIEIIPMPNTYLLRLVRIGVFPSIREWETVLRYFPYTVGYVTTDLKKSIKEDLYILECEINKESI